MFGIGAPIYTGVNVRRAAAASLTRPAPAPPSAPDMASLMMDPPAALSLMVSYNCNLILVTFYNICAFLSI